MPSDPSTYNYISRFDTASGSYHIYHDNIIIFRGKELSNIIFPAFFNELRTKTAFPDFFIDTQSTTSRFRLPSYINTDKLLDEIRIILPSALVFIHTWIRENSADKLLTTTFATYEDFFEAAFSTIISTEPNTHIRNIAINLNLSMKNIYEYLGSYHGNLSSCVYKTSDIVAAIMMLVYAAHILNNSISTGSNR